MGETLFQQQLVYDCCNKEGLLSVEEDMQCNSCLHWAIPFCCHTPPVEERDFCIEGVVLGFLMMPCMRGNLGNFNVCYI